MHTRRAGYTLIELVVALSLGFALLLGVWKTITLLGRQQKFTREATDMTSVALALHADLRREFARAGSGLFAAPNVSGVHVVPVDVGETPHDTLTLLYGLEGAAAVSSGDCEKLNEPCFSVMGDASWLEEGDLLLVGSSATGGRIVQVLERSDPYIRECGGDCDVVAVCVDDPGIPLVAPVVTAAELHDPNGTSKPLDGPCPQTYFPDGRWCEETVVNTVVGLTMSNSCTFSTPADAVYTDVRYVDRTAAFGFPPLATTLFRSGSTGVPAISAIEIGFVRYWLGETAEGVKALLKQDAMNPDGSWGPALPLAGNVESWGVWVKRRGDQEFRREVLADSAALVLDASNPNWVETPGPLPDTVLPGHRFLLSYQDIAAVRIAYTLRATEPVSGGEDAMAATFRVTFATPALLAGGVQR